MNTQEYLLTVLAEEAAEIIQAVSKIQRFGLNDVGPARSKTNADQLMHEFYDLQAVMQLLQMNQILPTDPPSAVEDMIEYKQSKVTHYMNYSREQGCLDE